MTWWPGSPPVAGRLHPRTVTRILRAMRRFVRRAVPVLVAVAAVAALAASQPAPARLTVTSATLTEGQPLPRQHTADGQNISPAIAWSGAPATTKSLALVCEDPDVPMPQPFVHWVVYNIPATASALPANLPIDPAGALPAAIAGAVQGPSGFRRPDLPRTGPAARQGAPLPLRRLRARHRRPARRPEPARNSPTPWQGHVVAQGELVATYERKPPAPPEVMMRRVLGLALCCAVAVCVAGTPALTQPTPGRRVAVTFDDLPGAPAAARSNSVPDLAAQTARLLSAFRSHHVPVTGFVNEGKLHVAGDTPSDSAAARGPAEALG